MLCDIWPVLGAFHNTQIKSINLCQQYVVHWAQHGGWLDNGTAAVLPRAAEMMSRGGPDYFHVPSDPD